MRNDKKRVSHGGGGLGDVSKNNSTPLSNPNHLAEHLP